MIASLESFRGEIQWAAGMPWIGSCAMLDAMDEWATTAAVRDDTIVLAQAPQGGKA